VLKIQKQSACLEKPENKSFTVSTDCTGIKKHRKPIRQDNTRSDRAPTAGQELTGSQPNDSHVRFGSTNERERLKDCFG